MKTLLLLCSLSFVLNITTNAQSYPIINKETLKNIVKNDKEHKFFFLTIFTNGCSSINDINENNQMIDSITNGNTRFILAQASRGNDRGASFENVVEEKKLPKKDIYFIDENLYKIDKSDSRMQGMEFRDDLCYECKFVEVGVTYKIIFDRKTNILYYGLFLNPSDVAAILSIK